MKIFDMLLSNAMMGESGGGGGGDFTTAQVTIINNSSMHADLGIPYVVTEFNDAEGYLHVGSNDSVERIVILYKGAAWVGFIFPGGFALNATGDIEVSNDGAIVTGNGTITITDA